MKVLFLSNFYNYHQEAFSQAINREAEEYYFVETAPMADDRKKMGWQQDDLPQYVIPYSAFCDNRREIERLVLDADVVIIGSAPLALVRKRIKCRKLTFRYSERIFKKPIKLLTWPLRVCKYFLNGYHRMHLLSASAYAYQDYKKVFCFKNRAYKWGYFPEVKQYSDVDALIAAKHPASLLWVGRLIDWKHPELPIRLAKTLKAAGYSFQLNIIGNGKMEAKLQEMISKNDLQDCVCLLGAMPPKQVREYMEKSQIFLFTSDRNEGWGAVLNEAMNSACAVVASNAIGSVPFLICANRNGYAYQDGKEKELFEQVRYLLDSPEECGRMGKAAYTSMTQLWNADTAAKRLLNISRCILSNNDSGVYEDGPCSKERE